MKNNKVKPIVYFVLFIMILLLAGNIFSNDRSSSGLDTLSKRLKDAGDKFLAKLNIGGRTPYSSTILTQEVVQEESQVTEVSDKVSPAVVSIVVKTVEFDFFNGPVTDEAGIGTGFIVERGGLIITNSHVVDSVNGEYSVVLKDGTSYDVSRIHLDQGNDLAILEVTARDLPTVSLGDSDTLKVGQTAIAIGNALGQFQNTVTVGVVSGVGRSITATSGFGGQIKTYDSVIQTDAAINPGNSGGPLLNIAGQVIGINVATSSGAENISFAIPVNTLKPILDSFIKEGRIIKPYIGVSYTMISKDFAALRRLPEGAFVTRVAPDTPASKAGVQRSDIITKFDGQVLGSKLSLSKAISSKKVGDTVTLDIDRNGNNMQVNVTLAEMPQGI